MHRFTVLALLLALAMAPQAAAEGDPQEWDFEFAGAGGEIPNPGIVFFPADVPPEYERVPIAFLQLEVNGLAHERPEDLNVFLVDPFGHVLEIMDDQGDQNAIVDPVDLVFDDKAGASLPDEGQIVSGHYLPVGPGMFHDAGFDFTGTDAWLLVVIDDDADRQDPGYFDSYTLRGVIPEPMTLSLLALGALAGWRRKRS